MKVADFMQKKPTALDENKPIRDVVRIIFEHKISAVPVLREKELVGIVTEEDILTRLFPSVKEVMEDFTHARSYESVEEKYKEMLLKPVKSIMTTPVKSVKSDTTVMRALSVIILNKFSHLPVIDDKNRLIGIISQGDFFRILAAKR